MTAHAHRPHAAAPEVGIGWRHPHYAALLEQRPALGFIEVHSENFFAPGGAALAVLREGRAHCPVSLHGVGLSLGSAAGLDPWHLDRLARLVQRVDPVRVSDHASFARAPRAPGQPVLHANDLLPAAFTPASLAIMAANVQRVQDRLQRPILVENLSAYLRWADDGLAEADFFNRLARRTGCGLLLDVNNLVVNALNRVNRGTIHLTPLTSNSFGTTHRIQVLNTSSIIDPTTGMVHPSIVAERAGDERRDGGAQADSGSGAPYAETIQRDGRHASDSAED